MIRDLCNTFFRITLLGIWISGISGGLWQSLYVPILGFIFTPLTTLVYFFLATGDLSHFAVRLITVLVFGVEVAWMILSHEWEVEINTTGDNKEKESKDNA